LIKNKKIKAYIISARYESLKADFNYWIKKIDPKKNFSGHYFNDENEQPYLFKEKIIKKLNLNIFIEDNWDIVQHISSKSKIRNPKLKVFWIYNIFDRNKLFPNKFSSLNSVVTKIKKLIE
jgi:hypothetical protein